MRRNRYAPKRFKLGATIADLVEESDGAQTMTGASNSQTEQLHSLRMARRSENPRVPHRIDRTDMILAYFGRCTNGRRQYRQYRVIDGAE